MSGYRRSDDYDYYDEAPRNRWDRDRFEQVRYERQESRPARAREPVYVEERPRVVTPPRFTRTRNDIFNDLDRDTSDRALQPYRRREEVEDDFVREIDRTRREYYDAPPRPGLLRRQSSLDTFDRRRPARYERDTHEVIEPVRVKTPPRERYREEYDEPVLAREAPRREEVRDVQIFREREVLRRPRARSDVRSVVSDARSSTTRASRHSQSHHSQSHHSPSHHSQSHHSPSVSSRSSSPSPVQKIGKKGHTKLPKGQFKRFAVERFGVDFTEDDEFFRLERALDKDMIDQILKWSREPVKEAKMTTYKFEGDRLGAPMTNEHVETIRTEWINPPSVRASSPARSQRTVRAASPVREEVRIIRENSPVPPAPPVIITQQPGVVQVPVAPVYTDPMTVAVTTKTEERSHEDVIRDIRRLELERELISVERGGRPHHNHGHDTQVIIQEPHHHRDHGYQVVEYKPHKEEKGDLYFVERERPREKGRKALVRYRN